MVNIVIAAPSIAGQVHAYSYHHNDTTTNESSSLWKPIGSFFNFTPHDDANTNDNTFYTNKICISPNGQFVALIYNNVVTGFRIRIVTLSTTSNNNTANDNMNDNNFVYWEQIGSDIVHPSSPSSISSSTMPGIDVEWIMSASLTDNLVLAIGCYTGDYFNPGNDRGTIYIYQWNNNAADNNTNNNNNNNNNSTSSWIRMGQAIQLHAWSLQLVLVQNNNTSSSSSSSSSSSTFDTTTTTLILALGGRKTARTFRYEPVMDSWTQFGSELTADNEDDDDIEFKDSLYSFGVMLSLSMTDAKTITVGLRNDALGEGIGLLRTYLYDALMDDWIQMDQDLKDSTFLFGHSFALSGNGKMLVTTTQELDVIVQDMIVHSAAGWVVGQIRTWDFIDTTANKDQSGASNGTAPTVGGAGSGKWIQREATLLEVGSLESGFGYKIALSEDGHRLATSAVYARNEQGVQAGKVRVFELGI